MSALSLSGKPRGKLAIFCVLFIFAPCHVCPSFPIGEHVFPLVSKPPKWSIRLPTHFLSTPHAPENGDRNPVFTRVLVSKSFIPVLFMHRTFRLFENNVRVEHIISNSAPRVWHQEFCYFVGNCDKLFSSTSTELTNVEKERSSSFCLPSTIYLA